MSDMREMLLDTARRLFEDHCPPDTWRQLQPRELPSTLWTALSEAGFTKALVPAEQGGAGLDVADALSLLGPAGYYALPAPLAETMIAGWLLSSSNLPVPDGPLTIAPLHEGERITARRNGAGWALSGSASRVPWAAQAAGIVMLAEADGALVTGLVTPAQCRITTGINLGGEPRDDVWFDGARIDAVAPASVSLAGLRAMGAVARSAQIAGALERILAQSVQYAQERVQFGRPIGKFQAVQQNLAVLAGQAAAAKAAADSAIDVVGHDLDSIAIACAKIRSGEAASLGASIAHQVHGAIGFTHEHTLHFSTRRLWSWRDEFGNEAHWAQRLGQRAAASGGDRLWEMITAA